MYANTHVNKYAKYVNVNVDVDGTKKMKEQFVQNESQSVNIYSPSGFYEFERLDSS